MKRMIIATVAAAGLAFSAASVSAQGAEGSEPEELGGGSEPSQQETQQQQEQPGAMQGSERMRGSEQEEPSELRQEDTSEQQQGTSGMPGETGQKGEYVVQEGDTLADIAERKLGSADKWRAIAEANNIQNPEDLEIGQRLTIPEDVGSATRPSMQEQPSEGSQQQPQGESEQDGGFDVPGFGGDEGSEGGQSQQQQESDQPY